MSREELDLTREKDVSDWFQRIKPRVVILAAAKVGGIEANNNNPTEFLLENIKIQNNVMKILGKIMLKDFCFEAVVYIPN